MSNVDEAGTAPGLVSKAQVAPKEVNMKCSRDGCDSLTAREIQVNVAPSTGQRVYSCMKCNHTRSISVGGPINI